MDGVLVIVVTLLAMILPYVIAGLALLWIVGVVTRAVTETINEVNDEHKNKLKTKDEDND